jgi:hypothetical protein
MKLSLCMSWRYIGEWRCNTTHSYPWRQLEVGGQPNTPTALYAMKLALVPHWLLGWVRPKADLGALEK